MKYLYLLLLLLPLALRAQLADTFADGDFTQNPTWTGDASGFRVASQVLQSNGPAVTGTQIQLVTPCQATIGTTWEFWANLKFATSAANRADVWLLASQADLKSAATTGYFVRLGGTDDEVSLLRKDSARTAVLVIDGQNNTLASSTNNLVRVRVTRSPTGQWTLARDLTGGRSFVAEAAQPTDNTYLRSAYFGVSLLYSAANSQRFYFDDFLVIDTTPPQLLRATARSARVADAQFSEPLSAASATAAHFELASGLVPLAAAPLAGNPAVVRLQFGQDVPGTTTLSARNVADLYGNVATGPLTAPLVALPGPPRPGELLLTELLADETPPVGLPAAEFVELYNNTPNKTLSLKGVRLLKPGSSTAAVLPDTARLLPGQYAVVCASSRAGQFAAYGKVYGVSNFPALTNAGDELVLRGPGGTTIFEVNYTDSWYRDTRKAAGGWTLEMIDPANYCAGAPNWQASQDPSGGTPGRRNSVAAPNPDRTPPALLRAAALSPTSIRLYFSEKLDSAAAANPALYRVQASVAGTSLPVRRAAPVAPDFRAVDLALGAALLPSQPVTVAVASATDCVGNASGPLTSANLALPEAAQPGDLVVNELLYYHRPGGAYFVEVLNRSLRYVSLQGYQLQAQRSTGPAAANLSPGAPCVLAPGQLLALTSDATLLAGQYPSSTDPTNLLAVSGFPALDNSSGTVALLDPRGQAIDSYAYDNGQQLALLGSTAGVSLERIRAAGPSAASNFHSAAGAVGYATPGRPNSQAQDAAGNGQDWTVTPELFTPDDDGQQDFTTLNYQLGQPGYVASVTVYDALGQLTRRLLRNESLPTAGFVQWDGLDERGHKAAIGYYILHVELFRPGSGERQEYKKTVVVGARL